MHVCVSVCVCVKNGEEDVADVQPKGEEDGEGGSYRYTTQRRIGRGENAVDVQSNGEEAKRTERMLPS